MATPEAKATVQEQRSEATSRGAALISGIFSFSSQGGDLYGGDADRFVTSTIQPNFLVFIFPGVGIGGEVSSFYQASDDASFTSLAIGPKVGYFFDSGSAVIPFITGGVSYLSLSDNDDFRHLIEINLPPSTPSELIIQDFPGNIILP